MVLNAGVIQPGIVSEARKAVRLQADATIPQPQINRARSG